MWSPCSLTRMGERPDEPPGVLAPCAMSPSGATMVLKAAKFLELLRWLNYSQTAVSQWAPGASHLPGVCYERRANLRPFSIASVAHWAAAG